MSEGAELVEGGERFYRMLVTQLRAGNHLWHRERRRVRTVAKVTTICRVEFDHLEGEPDHLDFPVHSPDARQWASKGIPMHGVGVSQVELEAGWEHRDTAATEHRPPYPTGSTY